MRSRRSTRRIRARHQLRRDGRRRRCVRLGPDDDVRAALPRQRADGGDRVHPLRDGAERAAHAGAASDRSTRQAAMRYAWQACASIYAAYGNVAPDELPAFDERGEFDADDLIEQAVAARDEHAIKFTEACLRGASHHRRSRLRRGRARRRRAPPAVGQLRWFARTGARATESLDGPRSARPNAAGYVPFIGLRCRFAPRAEHRTLTRCR